MLQRVSFSISDAELVGVLHLADGDSAGVALVLHGFGGHPDQPHIVETAAALAAAGVAAYRGQCHTRNARLVVVAPRWSQAGPKTRCRRRSPVRLDSGTEV